MWRPFAAAAIVCFAVGMWTLMRPTSSPPSESEPMANVSEKPVLATSPSDEGVLPEPRERAGSVRRRSPSIRRQLSTNASSDFVPWPGAAARPPFESGELVRIDLPASVLHSLGLWSPAAPDAVVQADVVIGQDGYARAVRLAQ